MCFSVNKHPKLKIRYKARVQATTKYAKTIDDLTTLSTRELWLVTALVRSLLLSFCMPSKLKKKVSFFLARPSYFFFSFLFLFFLNFSSSQRWWPNSIRRCTPRWGLGRTSPSRAWGKRWCGWSRRELRSLPLPPSLRLRGSLLLLHWWRKSLLVQRGN